MINRLARGAAAALVLALAALPASASELIMVGGIPLDFILFAATLLGVALFHSDSHTRIARMQTNTLQGIGEVGMAHQGAFDIGPGQPQLGEALSQPGLTVGGFG